MLLHQVGVDLPHFPGLVDRGQILHRHHAIRTMIAGVQQHLRSLRGQHLKPHRLEDRRLARRAGQLGVRPALDHLLQHGPGNTASAVAGLDGHIGQRAGLGIILARQVQGKTQHLGGIFIIQGQDQPRGVIQRAVHRVQIQVHLVANHVLIQLIERIAGRQRHRADVAEVVHHHL
ncbi:hypothetical protein D9M69_462520 [compost metagenome]